MRRIPLDTEGLAESFTVFYLLHFCPVDPIPVNLAPAPLTQHQKPSVLRKHTYVVRVSCNRLKTSIIVGEDNFGVAAKLGSFLSFNRCWVMGGRECKGKEG